jgi:hypothetical protein
MVHTTRLALHKPAATSETFGDYFPTVYAGDLDTIDLEMQMRDVAAAGHLAVFDEYGYLISSGVEPGDLAAGVDTVLTDQGMMLFAGAAGLEALSPDTDGKSLLTKGAAANPVFGYPSHETLTNLNLDGHSQYHTDARGDARYAPIAKGVTGGDAHLAATSYFAATTRILARKTAAAGVGEECTLTQVLDFIGSPARGGMFYRGATEWLQRAKGTAGQRLVQGADDPAWVTPVFIAPFPFGDGSAVLVEQSFSHEIPIASKITAARIRSYDAAGAPLSGSVTCTLYKHAVDAAIGTLVDTFAIASDNHMHETGLSIAVAAGNWLTIVISGITTCKQITCSLTMEPT